MAFEESALRPVLEFSITALVGITGWLYKGHNERIQRIETEQKEIGEDIEAHKLNAERYKLEAEQRFAKDIAVQATLSRLHERIDEISVDTKAILRKCGENRCVNQ